MVKSSQDKKLPFGKIQCTFECLAIKDTKAFDKEGNLKTIWIPVHSYYLYLFYKTADKYYLYWEDNEEPARALEEPEKDGICRGLYA